MLTGQNGSPSDIRAGTKVTAPLVWILTGYRYALLLWKQWMTTRVSNQWFILPKDPKNPFKYPGFFLATPCSIWLVPQPGIEPVPPAVEARSLNRWTTREVPIQALCLKQDPIYGSRSQNASTVQYKAPIYSASRAHRAGICQKRTLPPCAESSAIFVAGNIWSSLTNSLTQPQAGTCVYWQILSHRIGKLPNPHPLLWWFFSP